MDSAPFAPPHRVSQLTHHWTYHDVVAAEYGRAGLLSLKVAIIINNMGSMVRGCMLNGDRHSHS